MSKMFTLIKPIPQIIDDIDFLNLKYSFFRVKDKIVVKYDPEDINEDNVFINDTKEDKWSSMFVEYFKENEGHVLYN